MKRIAPWVALVLAGVIVGAFVGGALGAWLGGIATRRCQEMDCLDGLLWTAGGILVGTIAGGIAGWISGRRFSRRAPMSHS